MDKPITLLRIIYHDLFQVFALNTDRDVEMEVYYAMKHISNAIKILKNKNGVGEVAE